MSRTEDDRDRVAAGPRRTWWTVLAAVTLSLWLAAGAVDPAWGQDTLGSGGAPEEFEVDATLVAGSERMLYAVQLDREQGKFTLRFAEAESLGELLRGWRASGRVAALGAWDQSAYLIYSDHSVQAMTWRGAEPPQPRPFEIRQLPPLPRDGRVVDLVAVGDRELVVLMAPEDEEAEGPATAAVPSDGAEASEAAGDAADTDAAGEGPPDALDGEDATQFRAAAVEQLTLLRLSRHRWQRIELPGELAAADAIGLAQTLRGRVGLLTRSTDGQSTRLHTWRSDRPEEGWRTQQYDVEPTRWMRKLRVRDNRLLLRGEGPADAIDVYLLRPRPDRAEPLGRIDAIDTAERWWATPTAGQLTLIVADAEQRLARWTWDLRDPPTIPPADTVEPIELADMPTLTHEPIVWLLVAAMALALLMLLVTMGNAEANMPKLPPSLRPAGMPRVWAALIDFVPALLVSMVIFQVGDPLEVLRYWPSLSGEWDSMPPAITVIGLHALHTMLLELFTGRSLGKWLTGCRVVNLTGEAPHLWQVVGRNFFKILEMAVPWLLLLPVLPSLLPYQQRLGDLIGRTLVVVDVPEAEQRQVRQAGKGERPGGERDES